jgi:fatty-acyl-CoA synthase
MKPVATEADVRAIEAAGKDVEAASSTYELIRRSAERAPDAPALTFFMDAQRPCESETWNYREFVARINQTANAFLRLGVGKSDVVSYVLPNLPETHFTIWGGEAVGVVAAFNPLLEPSALAALLAAAGTKVLVTAAPFQGFDLWRRLRAELAAVATLEHVILVDMSERLLGPARNAVRVAQRREPESTPPDAAMRSDCGDVAVHDFWTLVSAEDGDRLNSGRVIAAEDRSSMFCTGGTTGQPKIAIRRQGCEVANAVAVSRFMGDAVGPGKTLFCGLPLFHVNGVLVTGLLPFSRGAHVVLGTPQGFRGENVVARFWEIVERHGVNFFSGVPTLYASLMQVPVGEHDISSLEYGLCGAAPMPAEVFRTFQEQTGLKILEGYGLTEATCVSSINPPGGERRIGSIGLRLPGQEMKTVKLDDGGGRFRDCAPDEVGAIIVSGPNVFEGYLSPEHNRALWIDCGDGRKWLDTGDLGRRDSDGYFWLTGRKKELIIRGGHNIDPASIEEPLHRHPDVLLAAAVGRPDAHAGELPVAYIQLRPGATATEAELTKFARATIGERAAQPKHIRVVDQIPLTPVGKIFKPALKYREIESALGEALAEAGVPASRLTAGPSSSQGVTVTVELVKQEDETAARQVLGAFPYPYVFRTAG